MNDVLSLIVGLWAVKVANQESKSKTYTYGVRRETRINSFLGIIADDAFSGNVQKLWERW